MTHLRAARFGGLAALVVFYLCSTASAQDAPELREHHVSINAGGTWLGGYDVGQTAAQLRGNGNGVTPPAFTLFNADSHFSTAFAPELRVGLSITSRLVLEAGATLAHPRIGVRISGDAEAAVQELPGEELEQYLFDGGLNWQLPVDLGRRLAPFVSGGAGYLRQLHEDRTLAETGRIYYGGAGVRYWLRGGQGKARAAGLRGEFRINARSRGIDFDDAMRRYPSFALFVFAGL